MTAQGRPTDLDSALRAAESSLRRGGEPSALQVDALRDLASAHPERAARLAGRLDRVFATTALRGRGVPEGLLDGIYDSVRVAAQDDRFGRARMSTAFLEAPRSLVAWRRMAVAASVLLAVGVVWTSTREAVVPRGGGGQPLSVDEDPRYHLLETVPTGGSGFSATPAGFRDMQPAGTPVVGERVRRNDPVYRFFDGNEWRSEPGVARPRVNESGR